MNSTDTINAHIARSRELEKKLSASERATRLICQSQGLKTEGVELSAYREALSVAVDCLEESRANFKRIHGTDTSVFEYAMTTHVTPPGERDSITRPEICSFCHFPIRKCQCFVEPDDGEYSEEIETE